MTKDTTYGWTNYATWRVNLEIFDGMAFDDWGFSKDAEVYEISASLRSYAEKLIEQSSGEGLARDYALAFLSDVNWAEIARHVMEYENA